MSIEEIIKWLEGMIYAPEDVALPIETVLRNEMAREAIALLKTLLDAQPNEPLTLEELREIDGVVWVCYPQATFGTRLPPTDQLTCTRYKFSFSDYGKTWLAYRRPPKEN